MAVQLSRPRVALGSPVDVTYRFTVAADAAPLGTRKVFAHFVDVDGEQMWTDDHDPPTPTSAWKPGQTIEYSRTVFAPVYPYVGQAKIIGGLYDTTSGDRVKLSGTDAGGRAYEVAQLELLPQTENIFLIFKDGWHAVETAGDNSMVEWQWTKKEATITFRNPRRDAMLFFQADNPGRRRPPPGRSRFASATRCCRRCRSAPTRCRCTRFRSAPRPWAAARWSSCG